MKLSYGQKIPIKTRSEIDRMREAGRHVAEILVELRDRVRPGVGTEELDRYARKLIRERGLTSSFLGYGPYGLPAYPAVLCVSVNEEIVHGIPGGRVIREGDIVSLDFGVSVEGWHGDSAVTVCVGDVTEECRHLVEVTRESLDRAIKTMRCGQRLSDIGHAVQEFVEPAGYSVVRDFAGHGIGAAMHEPPWIPNYGPRGRGPRLVPGMVFAIEPMVNAGAPDVEILDDEWTAVTVDGAASAHFEHTILVTDDGPEVLTQVAGSH
ncbi:MAG: type I methionyl aminopeptidase [Myxococcota bacterium]|mgnify:CR=1 FL=1|nr:type I methionyl aminopeptidase [Myxococcota bacterium]MDP6243904.1 type I methionyl aminopeptidase [Myxococcota bacterium]MDP7075882.1 type I methionyl aminopeptidase [Myxococcota bacterium]MDP7300988.1 type I methionyl aminopeptidase [Myxococcota bacterium]MDP7431707.1 type I methionyl aminopeptidase [Myxococcota bacterium]